MPFSSTLKKMLVVVDMQYDFVNGALGSKEAQGIVPKVCEKIKGWDGDIMYTQDIHPDKLSYKMTVEGQRIPVHCVKDTKGSTIVEEVQEAIVEKSSETHKYISKVEKIDHFADTEVAWLCSDYDYVEFVGLCTDICVISNALLLRSFCPQIEIAVDASCCAGTNDKAHKASLLVMKSCCIDILNDQNTVYRGD